MRIVLGITGASGVIYGVRVLETLHELGIETHLVLSRWAKVVIREETDLDPDVIEKLATVSYSNKDMGAAISSSSFGVDGMAVCPTTVKTLSEIARAGSESLIGRAADIQLRTRRRLVVAFREAPVSLPMLENCLSLARAGAVMLPLAPGFYHRPKSLQDMIDFGAGKVLDMLGVEHELYKRWKGMT